MFMSHIMMSAVLDIKRVHKNNCDHVAPKLCNFLGLKYFDHDITHWVSNLFLIFVKTLDFRHVYFKKVLVMDASKHGMVRLCFCGWLLGVSTSGWKVYVGRQLLCP